MITNDNFALNIPLNSTSFGGISYNITKELFDRKSNPSIFLIGGNADLSAQKPNNDYNNWLQQCAGKAFKNFKRTSPLFRLWHTNFDAMSSFSNEESILTFIESDALTEIERNILSQKKNVFVTCKYLQQTCSDYGINAKLLEIGFDKENFHVINKKYFDDDRIVFNIYGKAEFRKHTKKVIQTWLKKFGVPKTGQRPKYFLQCFVYNPFYVQNINGQMVDRNNDFIKDCLNGNEYGNIQFFPWTQQNAAFNDCLNSASIVIGLSGSENIGLPERTSVGLGKHSVILQAAGYKDWATESNSCLVNPCAKIPLEDGIFFTRNSPFQSNGNFYDWNPDEAISAMELAIKRYESNPINTEGLKIQELSYKNTVDTILENL